VGGCASSAGWSRYFLPIAAPRPTKPPSSFARRYGHEKGITRPEIIVADNAFHGRTLGALTATGNSKAQKGFGPLPEGFVRVPYNDAAAIEAAGNKNTVAVLIEPIQGEGGIRIPDMAI